MRTHRLLATAVLSLLVSLSACSGSSDSDSGGSSGSMWVVSCSLGCTNGLGNDGEIDQVFCSIVNTFQNQELSILFSEPIDLFSVNTSSFRVVNVANGTSPSGQFFIDPLEPKRLIFRPSLSFDVNGNPVFGFLDDTTYQITIPGTAQGDGPPYVHSTSGRPNLSRMQCTILTSEGIIDPVPGSPSVEIRVSLVTSYDENGDPDGFLHDALAGKDPELIDVYRDTTIQFEFNDIMNVATLVNPSTGHAPFILVEVDDDGSLATLNDRVAVEGSFVFSVDQERLETYLTFSGDLPFPSAGQFAPLSPRRIAVTVPSSVQDLVSNPVLPDFGGGTTGMVPELSQFSEVTLPYDGGEDFTDSTNEDVRRSGAFWGGGRLAPGVTGGAGQLGDLVIPTNFSVVLNTDSQVFPLGIADGFPYPMAPDVMGNPNPTGGGDPGLVDDAADFPDMVTINDGAFTFSVVEVEPGSRLRFEGDQPVRLWSRGTSTIQAGGEIDLVGATPAQSDSLVAMPEATIPALSSAANGGQGGYGGDRFDMVVNQALLNSGEPESDAIENPGADPDGRKGGGVGQLAKASGPGGSQWPTRYPTENLETEPGNNNNHGVTFNVSNSGDFGKTDTQCRSLIVGQAGGGGGYATDGGVGHAESSNNTAQFPAGASNTPPDTAGGDSSELGLAPPDDDNTGYFARQLRWKLGHLRGGSGGGGGGNHPYGSWATGYNDNNTNDCINNAALSRFVAWHDHSGAQGGYGGGAMHYVSGKKLVIDGTIDLRGGNGGAPRGQGPPTDPDFDADFGWYASPGGGGSGGALRLRSLVIEIADVAGRIDLRGGNGGTGFVLQSNGGEGGTGLLRIEDQAGLIDRTQIADDVSPFEPSDNSLGWISVAPGELNGIPRERPDSMSGSTSCWMKPDSNFFALGFIDDEDDDDTGDPGLMGWNMTVIWDSGGGEQSFPFRGANTLFMGSFENQFGKLLGFDLDVGESAAPLVVRFQGARVIGDPNLCDLDLSNPDSGVSAGSVTPWVDHPALLNTYNPAPNIVRFAVLFDGTLDNDNNDSPGLLLNNIKGVTGLWIRTLPD